VHKRLQFEGNSFDDYVYWQTQDRKTLLRINQLLRDIDRNGNVGIGKPEPLSFDLNNYWSRRIDNTNRLVYYVDDEVIHIFSCRYHYGK